MHDKNSDMMKLVCKNKMLQEVKLKVINRIIIKIKLMFLTQKLVDMDSLL